MVLAFSLGATQIFCDHFWGEGISKFDYEWLLFFKGGWWLDGDIDDY